MNELVKVEYTIFDFDGVLADTETGRFKQLNHILSEKKGIDLNKQSSINQLIGLSTIAFFRKYFPQFTEQEIVELSYIRQIDYINNLEKYCIPYPMVKETLRILKKKKLTLILATANETSVAHILLKHIGVDELFSQVIGREIMEDSNGNKQYTYLRDKLLLPIDKSVVIEDSYIGVNAAKNADFYTIAINRYNDDKVMNKADVCVNDYNQLLKLFDNN